MSATPAPKQTVVQKAVADIKAVISKISTEAAQTEQSLIPKIKIYVQVHFKALLIGVAAGGVVGFIVGHII